MYCTVLNSLLGGLGGFFGFLLGCGIALPNLGHVDRLGKGDVVNQTGTLQVRVSLVAKHVGVETELGISICLNNWSRRYTYLRLRLSVVEWKDVVEESNLVMGEVYVESLHVALQVSRWSVPSKVTPIEDVETTYSIFLPPMIG